MKQKAEQKERTHEKAQLENPDTKADVVTEIVEETVPTSPSIPEEHVDVDVLSEDAVRKVEEAVEAGKIKTEFDAGAWIPKTELGRKVKAGVITQMDEILDAAQRIMEPEIIDYLLKDLEVDLLLIGQAKGKFGGGQRRLFRQTQKKTKEGNKPKFSTFAIVGNRNGYIGIGYGKAKETVPAREKAIREAKLHVFKIKRGNGSWQDKSKEAHTLPFSVSGKCGSVRIKLMPAPKGTGLCVEKECQKLLRIAGIKNVWSKSLGHRATKMNMILACVDALRKLSTTKTSVDSENVDIGSGEHATTE